MSRLRLVIIDLVRSPYAPLYLVLIAAIYRISTFGGSLGGYDEKLYMTFIWNYHTRGIQGIRNILYEFQSDPILMYGPLPLRFLYVQVGNWVCQILGGYTYVNLARLSLISGIGIVGVGSLLLRRWFSPLVAFFGGLLLVFSPLASGLSRRALQDPFFCLMILCTFYYFHMVWHERKVLHMLLLAFFLLASFLTKESTLVLYPIFLLIGWYYHRSSTGGWPVARILIIFEVVPLAYLGVMWWVAGDLKLFFSTYVFYANLQSKADYVQRYLQGPWFRYIIDLLLISPLTYLFSLLFLVNNEPFEKRGNRIAALYTAGILVVFSSLALLDVRTILFVDIPLRGLAAAGVFGFSARMSGKYSREFWITTILILLICTDLLQFFRMYWFGKLYDPTTYHLIRANGLFR